MKRYHYDEPLPEGAWHSYRIVGSIPVSETWSWDPDAMAWLYQAHTEDGLKLAEAMVEDGPYDFAFYGISSESFELKR